MGGAPGKDEQGTGEGVKCGQNTVATAGHFLIETAHVSFADCVTICVSTEC